MPKNQTQSKPTDAKQESGKGLDAMTCSSFDAWKASKGSTANRLELQAKWANLQQMRDRGKAAYEADVLERPTYHDKTPRKTWNQLGEVEQWSWGKDYNLETNAKAQAPRPAP